MSANDTERPIPDDAVRAAARAMYLAKRPGHPTAADDWDSGRVHRSLYLIEAEAALSAALPHLAPMASVVDRDDLTAILRGVAWHTTSPEDGADEILSALPAATIARGGAA